MRVLNSGVSHCGCEARSVGFMSPQDRGTYLTLTKGGMVRRYHPYASATASSLLSGPPCSGHRSKDSELKMEGGRKCQVITHLRQGRLENENENEDQGKDSLLLASGSARLGIWIYLVVCLFVCMYV
jgi:hypothetical protein